MPGKKRNNRKNDSRSMVLTGTAPRKIPSTFLPGPDSARSFLAYEGTYGLVEAGAGQGAFQVMRLNSIYDPDFTGVGVTALGYTTWQNYYSKYRVIGARAIVRFVNVTGGGQIQGILWGTNSTITVNPTNWPAEPQSFSKLSTGATGSRAVNVFDRTFDLWKVASVTREQYIVEESFAAAFGSNPANNLYLYAWMTGKLSSAAQTANIEVRIIYDVEFYGRLQSVTA